MNAKGMLPYEESVSWYIPRTGNHVLYRVTPLFDGDNLAASGVVVEGRSIEGNGAGVSFCIWCYNIEPGVVIDYATGDSRVGNPESEVASTDAGSVEKAIAQGEGAQIYVPNTNTHRFHHPDCSSVLDMKEKNKQIVEMTRDEIIEMGYRPCGVCNP